jgi:hypothetical protein
MPRFRSYRYPAAPSTGPLTLDVVRGLIAKAVRPVHFFVGPATHLEWNHVATEDVPWEVFRGRLLDPAHTRQRRTFEAWNVYLIGEGGRSPEPLLSVKLDAVAGQVHVVRAIHSYTWEGYDAGGNVILSRETKKWVRELVGTIDLADFATADDLLDEIVCRLFQAVVGTSRLPLTSVEAPLPAFTFGELAYLYRPNAGADEEAMTTEGDLLDKALSQALSRAEKAKLLELLLRRPQSVSGTGFLAGLFDNRWERLGHGSASDILSLTSDVFNGVSLSPYTRLPETALRFLRVLESGEHFDTAALADFLGRLLRQIGRHLTSYDLVQFHHAGANYPDALLLDVVLREYLSLLDAQPALFLDSTPAANLRRRALRQAWLIRERYRGHLVPDAPTSPGENSRVLPEPHARVPDEQIAQPHRRSKRLFTEDAPGGSLGKNAAAALRQSIRDLDYPEELRELGQALYLDRPLGALKAPGEPDQTLMLSYTAFSRSIAAQRLLLLGRDQNLFPADELARYREALQSLAVVGLPLSEIPGATRPGAVSLADARKAADDFVFLRTTAQTTRAFFDLFDFRSLSMRFSLTLDAPLLIVGRPALGASGEILLTVYEAGTLRKRTELSANPADGYICRGGVEYPRKGLCVRRVWVNDGGTWREHDLSAEQLLVIPWG